MTPFLKMNLVFFYWSISMRSLITKRLVYEHKIQQVEAVSLNASMWHVSCGVSAKVDNSCYQNWQELVSTWKHVERVEGYRHSRKGDMNPSLKGQERPWNPKVQRRMSTRMMPQKWVRLQKVWRTLKGVKTNEVTIVNTAMKWPEEHSMALKGIKSRL